MKRLLRYDENDRPIYVGSYVGFKDLRGAYREGLVVDMGGYYMIKESTGELYDMEDAYKLVVVE